MSNKNEVRGPKGAQIYRVTPLGVVEALMRGGVRSQMSRVAENWVDVSPMYVHHWADFVDAGVGEELWRCLWRLYPERVIINRIVPLDVHEMFQSYIQPTNFEAIRNGLDHVLLDMSIRAYGVSSNGLSSLCKVISSDLEYMRVWNQWFWMEENKFKNTRKLNKNILRGIV